MSSIFTASIKERYCLNRAGSLKETFHLVLDLKGSGIQYEVGDCLAILPRNEPCLVSTLLQRLDASAETAVLCKDLLYPAYHYLLEKSNLHKVPRSLVTLLFDRSVGADKERLEPLIHSENRTAFKDFSEKTTLLDLLLQYPHIPLTAQEVLPLLLPLLPRFYSIASAQKVVGEEAHLTVGLAEQREGEIVQKGVCSNFLCHYAPLFEKCIPLYHHTSRNFKLPQEAHSHPLIMVGPGTGIAPFRAFMQERTHLKASSKNWLFFGERQSAYDFYYQEYWENLQTEGALRLSVAFSRDQTEKFYVQHQLKKQASEIFSWLQEGAYFFVCGDASRMAKDVDALLHEIVQEEGSHSPQAAKEYILSLKKTGRYQRDVY